MRGKEEKGMKDGEGKEVRKREGKWDERGMGKENGRRRGENIREK